MPVTVTEATSWIDLLQKGGGWAMFLVACGVIVKLWLELKAKDARLFEVLDKTNSILELLTKEKKP